ncbi:MAG: diguanylate cyclase, partial [Merismopedia sp. SIO2A8]|nr:diguanylate cyclase [Merismopedia sp. SIO2A8]
MTLGFPHSDEQQNRIYYHLDHRLPDSEHGYRQLIETLREVVFKVDRSGHLTFLNAAWARALGYPVKDALGHHLCKFLHPDDWSIGEMILHHLSQDGRDIRQELRFQHQSGSVRWLEMVAHSDPDGGVLGTLFDITDHKEAINQLRYAANHDVLTGLLNRAAFTEELRQTIAQYQYDVNEHFAILFLDLDGFKLVNDSLGHLIGDQLLKEVSARIKSCLRPMDAIAR